MLEMLRARRSTAGLSRVRWLFVIIAMGSLVAMPVTLSGVASGRNTVLSMVALTMSAGTWVVRSRRGRMSIGNVLLDIAGLCAAMALTAPIHMLAVVFPALNHAALFTTRRRAVMLGAAYGAAFWLAIAIMDGPASLLSGIHASMPATMVVSAWVYTTVGAGLADRDRLHAQVQGALQREEGMARRFEALLANGFAATRLLDTSGTVLYDTEPVRAILGYDPEATVGTSAFDPLHPDDWARVAEQFAGLAGTPGGQVSSGLRYRHADGSWRDLQGVCTNLLDDPDVGALVLNFRDVTEQVQLEQELRLQASRFESLVAHAYDATRLLAADGTVLWDSESVGALTGWTSVAAVGTNAFVHMHPADAQDVLLKFQAMVEAPGATMEARVRYRYADGSWAVLEGRLTNLLCNPAVEAVVLNFRDVTRQAELEEELRRQASHDSLTGLPNREVLMDHLDRALRRDARRQELTAVLFLDLDDFKPVNDTLGHAAGDTVLRAVATRLLQNIRATDVACRMGGDEFAVVLTDLDDEDAARAAAARMLELVQTPLVLDGAIVPVTASMGMAVSTRGVLPEQLLRRADTAMYQAKRDGKGAMAVFRGQGGADPQVLQLLRAAE